MSDYQSTAHTGQQNPSTGDLVSQLSEQTSRLIRDELRLAQLELTAKGKRAGAGVGLFGGAGLFAFYGVACVITAVILALAGPLPDWLAALIVGAALLIVAGIAALVGKREVASATPPVPEEAIAGLKQDAQTLNPRSH
ncbi:MAG TPA: phage holin family protein [Jatrophihabitans sp.]|jgi:uncharacterized membrane protein YqjE